MTQMDSSLIKKYQSSEEPTLMPTQLFNTDFKSSISQEPPKPAGMLTKSKSPCQHHHANSRHTYTDASDFFFFGPTGGSTAFSYWKRENRTVQEWHV
jgi:hypothetical protein